MRIALRSPFLAVLTTTTLAIAAWPALAAAEAPAAQWTIQSVSMPTNFSPAAKPGEDFYRVTVTNTGGAPSAGPVEITDELPDGLSLDQAGATAEFPKEEGVLSYTTGPSFACAFGTCTYTGVVPVDESLILEFPVDISPSIAAEVTNTIHVSGGGATDAALSVPTAISEHPAGFGIAPGGASTALSTTQAGAHPDITTSIAFNTVDAHGSLAGDPRTTVDELPPGFAGNLIEMPVCAAATFALEQCPVATQVGVVTLDLIGSLEESLIVPVYNVAPDPGQVAKLAFEFGGGGQYRFEGGVSVRPGDYGINAEFANAEATLIELDGVTLTVWGVPADKIHNPLRATHDEALFHFGTKSEAALTPFFTNPTSCGDQPLTARFGVDSWQHPGQRVFAPMSIGPMVGCDRLTIEPKLEALPTSTSAETSTGLSVDLQSPQGYENPEGLVSSQLDGVTVALPQGMGVNPSAGAGLASCTMAQFEYEGSTAEPAPGLGCPSESKVGVVHVHSPAVPEEATGSVFIAKPFENQFHSLLALYVVARIPVRGVVVTAAGDVHLDPVTGQLTTTFSSNPQLPFSDFNLKFTQGATAPLVTPPACGSFSTDGILTPWSVPGQEHLVSSSFGITSGVDGGPCPAGGVPPFDPTVISGTQSNAGGAYSPFYLRIDRQDGEQEITRFSTTLPPGLTGNLSGIPFCPDADIEASKGKTGAEEEASPSCPAASEVGHTIVEAGVGTVLAQTPGKVYLAGPYHGAPLSVVSVTSAKVGPFDLGTVVVHLPLQVDPLTAAVSIPAGAADQIPHIIDGIVVHVRDIRVYVDRPNFMINPTNCEAQRLSATVIGSGLSFTDPADDRSVSVTDPFQVANCARLAFKPRLTVSTSGKTSRRTGASLHVELVYPKTPQGSEANIRSVKVDLPKQLPSQLKTLQQACPDRVFNQNPAACGAASRIGMANATTPILPVALSGPVYFVSHGGAKFPELVIVLSGDGVTVQLHSETFISKAGITSSTFHAIPDVPVGTFELTLPQGKFPALAANGNLCNQKLKMPTAFTAQNGAVIHQSTPIAVTGCARHKAKAKHARHTGAHGHGGKP